MKLLSLMAVSAVLLVFGACNESTRPSNPTDDIRGRVVDVDGRPVANAAIVLEHEFAYGVPSPADKPNVMIRFTLPDPGQAQLWITPFCGDDTVRALLGESLPAAEYAVVWNGLDDAGRLSPDGVYWAHVVTPAESRVTPILLANLGYAGLPAGREVAAQATTSRDGRFRLGQDCLPFGFEFPAPGEPYGETGLALTRRVRVWALHEDYAPTGSDWVTIDAEDGADVVITLPR